MRDLNLTDPDALDARVRLGAAFFTRRLNPRYRARCVAELTTAQRAAARRQGWIR